MSNKYPAIPEPRPDVDSLHNTTISLKEAVEVLTGQRRGSPPPVTWEDLVRLGVVERADIPR